MEQLQERYPTLKRAIVIVALAVILRVAIVMLHRLEQLDYKEYSNWNFFTLPVLELTTLLLVIAPSAIFRRKRNKISDVGVTILPAVLINAILRIVELIRSGTICNGPDFYTYEKFCELIGMQSICNIPFVFIGALVLWIWKFEQRPRSLGNIITRRMRCPEEEVRAR